jgi:hypothetical protein
MYLHGCDILTLIHRPPENGKRGKWLAWGSGVLSPEGSAPLGLVTLYQQEQARLLSARPIDPEEAELLALQQAVAANSGSDTMSEDDEHDGESTDCESDETTDSNRHLIYTASGKTRRAMGDWDHRLNRMNGVMPILLSDSVEAYMERTGIDPPMRSAIRAVCDACEPSTANGDYMEVQKCLEPLLRLYDKKVPEDFLCVYLPGFES